MTQNNHAKQCYKFGITHHNQSYEANVSIIQEQEFYITGHNITHATINDTGIYSCYYKPKFTTTAKNTLCPKHFSKDFNIIVKGTLFF